MPLSLCSFHAAKIHHAQVHERRKGWGANVWECMVYNDDTGTAGRECCGGLCEDLTTSLIRPIVEDMAEEVDQGTCPQQLVSACGKRFGGTMI